MHVHFDKEAHLYLPNIHLHRMSLILQSQQSCKLSVYIPIYTYQLGKTLTCNLLKKKGNKNPNLDLIGLKINPTFEIVHTRQLSVQAC